MPDQALDLARFASLQPQPNVTVSLPPAASFCRWNAANGGTRTFAQPAGEPRHAAAREVSDSTVCETLAALWFARHARTYSTLGRIVMARQAIASVSEKEGRGGRQDDKLTARARKCSGRI